MHLLKFWLIGLPKIIEIIFKIFASNSIMFNHESPRRGVNFVTKKIVRGLCRIQLGKQEKINAW